MEYISGGDLKEQLDEVEFFSEKRAKFYAAEITLSVQFLHQFGILYQDLKLESKLFAEHPVNILAIILCCLCVQVYA